MVAFMVKIIKTIFFACLIGKLDSSPVEIKKNKAPSLKKTAWAYACVGVNTIMAFISPHAIAHAIILTRALTRATILGTLCTCVFSELNCIFDALIMVWSWVWSTNIRSLKMNQLDVATWS